MSHFTVIVVGENVAEQLQPFHEFECTGTDDRYVVDVDRLPELRVSYEKETKRRLRAPDGSLYEPWDNAFYRDPTPEEASKVGMGSGFAGGISYHSRDWGDGFGYRAKVQFVPDGYVEADVPVREFMTFAEFVAYEMDAGRAIEGAARPALKSRHKYGWFRVLNGEVTEAVRRTNPNAKWDWWVVGGRWTGYFTTKEGTGELGKMPTAFSEEDRAYYGRERAGYKADTCLWGDVAIDAMQSAARDRALASFAKWEAIFVEHGRHEPWNSVRDRLEPDYEAARKFYNDQPAVVAYRKTDAWENPDRFGFDRDAYVERETKRAIVPFAILKDGIWHEKGDMGWWGCVSDEKSDWTDRAFEMLTSLSPATRVTLVDCHI